MILRQPVPQARRHQQHLLAVTANEVLRHTAIVLKTSDDTALRNSHPRKEQTLTRRTKLTAAAGAALAALALGGGAIVQASGDDGERSVTGPQADRATAAALQITKGGKANSGDNENGATWEVEVTKPDGKTVDVRLDEKLGLVIVEGDTEDEAGAEQ